MKQGSLKGRDEMRSRRFVRALRQLLERRERPLDRATLARDIGVDPSLLSLLLSQQRHPTPAFVGRLCRHPSVTAEEALALISAHLEDVATEALPQSGPLTVSLSVALKDDRRRRAQPMAES